MKIDEEKPSGIIGDESGDRSLERTRMKIRCGRWGAMPFPPVASGFRSDFDLLKLTERKTDDGNIKWWAPAGDSEGEWFCSLHRRETSAGRFTVTEASP